jgi:hypothetical protein
LSLLLPSFCIFYIRISESRSELDVLTIKCGREGGDLCVSELNQFSFLGEIILLFCCVTCSSLSVGSGCSVSVWAKPWFDGVARSPFLPSLDLSSPCVAGQLLLHDRSQVFPAHELWRWSSHCCSWTS